MPASTDIVRIIGAYNSLLIRLYVRIRFHILRQRFLGEIGQYLPQEGRILDVGCGFGLFSLFYAMFRPRASIEGLDLNTNRIRHAALAAEQLHIANVRYQRGDASSLTLSERYDAIYMLDIVHHIPASAVAPLLASIYSALNDRGVLLIKDIAYHPAYKRWFTWWLDKLMDPRTPVNYWKTEALLTLLRQTGFTVYSHHMVDYLPYPHILYICRKSS